MAYNLTICNKQKYLHAKVTGENSLENVKLYLEEILQTCIQQDCQYVLIEEQLDGPRLDTLEVFDVASEKSEQSLGIFKAVAYVDVNAKNNEMMRFAETVAVNRGLPARVFPTVAEAEQWLQDKFES